MGTTRIKVIDLSSDKEEVKASRKHAEKLALSAKISDSEAATDEKQPAASQPKEELAQDAQTLKPEPKKTTRHMGMNYLKATKSIDKNQNYSITEAIDLLYKTSYTKFDPAVELHINVTNKNVKANVNFPHSVEGKVKEKKYLVFSEKKSEEIKNIIWADEKTIADIQEGKLKPKKDFDLVIASPKFMPLLAKVAKILGPAGMMPNPKNQTVTENPQKVIESTKDITGVEFRTDQTAPILHTKIGKLSNKPNQIEENLKALILAVGIGKIQKATLKSTMSPAIRLDLTQFHK